MVLMAARHYSSGLLAVRQQSEFVPSVAPHRRSLRILTRWGRDHNTRPKHKTQETRRRALRVVGSQNQRSGWVLLLLLRQTDCATLADGERVRNIQSLRCYWDSFDSGQAEVSLLLPKRHYYRRLLPGIVEMVRRKSERRRHRSGPLSKRFYLFRHPRHDLTTRTCIPNFICKYKYFSNATAVLFRSVKSAPYSAIYR